MYHPPPHAHTGTTSFPHIINFIKIQNIHSPPITGTMTSTPPPNYLLEVTITDTETPTITRYISVPATINFHDLHLVIQTAFGWGQCHPYQFSVEKPDTPVVIELPQVDGPSSHSEKSSTETLFSDVLESAQRDNHVLLYQYDVDLNSWMHRIKFVSRMTPGTETAVCIAGEGHPCSEDVGGPSGWRILKEAFHLPYEKSDFAANRMRKWYRNDCINGDPEGLATNGPYRWDREAVNRELSNLEFGTVPEEEDY